MTDHKNLSPAQRQLLNPGLSPAQRQLMGVTPEDARHKDYLQGRASIMVDYDGTVRYVGGVRQVLPTRGS